MLWKLVPLASFALFLALVILRSWIQIRRTGRSGRLPLRSMDARGRVRAVIGLIVLAILLVEVLAAAAGKLSIAPSTAARAIGAALGFGGSLVMFAAQMNLGASWRVGIEEGARPGLVTTGFYRFCRNPIFLFMFAAFGGITLLLWNLTNTSMWVGLLIGVRFQVLTEERWLLRTYGDEYRRYASGVGRFLPRIGRLL